MRPRVFVTQPIAASALARLEAVADVAINNDPLHICTRDELIAAVRDADALYCMLHDRVDAGVIDAAPCLKVIGSTTVTPADIDLAAASRRRIPVTAVPSSYLDDATADLAWALLFAVGRRLAESDRLVRAGIIPGSQSCYLESLGISGRTLGIVGMGGVGKAAARRARGFPLRRIYHDPRRLSADEERELDFTWVELDELLRESDYVSLHVNLRPETRHLIGERELGLMKPTAYLINTARGPIVDEAALVRALGSGGIAGAGLDVFEHEPGIPAELRGLPNTVLAAHIGSAVRELREKMANTCVDTILEALAGRRPAHVKNPEIYAAA